MKKHFLSGIDMSADSFNVCLLKNGPGGSRIDGAFRNTKAGIQKFLTWLRENGVTSDNSTLVVENTGVYDDLFLPSAAERLDGLSATDNGPETGKSGAPEENRRI